MHNSNYIIYTPIVTDASQEVRDGNIASLHFNLQYTIYNVYKEQDNEELYNDIRQDWVLVACNSATDTR